jgi:glycosyltransferase involved in cell wall biosynthesis
LKFRGHVTENEVTEILSETDLLVVPSITDNSPSVIKEGQRSGCLVLATDVGGIKEIIENERNGILCAPDEIAIRTQLDRIAARKFEIEICKKAIIEFEKQHGSDLIVQQHLEVYNAK